MLTQRAIAERMQISQATVSQALKGTGRMSEELRARILSVATEMGYRPHLAGQLLRGGQSNVIGVVLPTLRNEYFAELFQELQTEIMRRGYLACLLCYQDAGEVEEARRHLSEMRVARVVLHHSGYRAFRSVLEKGMRVVVYGGDAPLTEEGVSQVLPERYGASLELMRHLLARGYRRIAFLGRASEGSRRYAAYRAALEEAGIGFVRHYADEEHEETMAGGYAMMSRLLDSGEQVDAVFAHNDDTAIGALRAASERGLRVPDDLALAGFDNIRTGGFLKPSLTTVEQPRREMARQLLQELFAGMRQGTHHHAVISVPCQLIVREST